MKPQKEKIIPPTPEELKLDFANLTKNIQDGYGKELNPHNVNLNKKTYLKCHSKIH